MTAAERLGAALATVALSYRISELYQLDQADDCEHGGKHHKPCK